MEVLVYAFMPTSDPSLLDRDPAAVEVDVLPPEPEQLAPAHPSREEGEKK